MDRHIAEYPAEPDADLMLCLAHGVAYQRDRTHQVCYDAAYYDKCAGYEGQDIAERINAGRIAMVERHYGSGRAVDIGIGAGEFVRKRPHTYGRDVNPVAIEWLHRNDLWAHFLNYYRAFTFWDVLEHVETPESYFVEVRPGAYLFTSLPIFEDLGAIRASRHYRPGEHLFYWTEGGFVAWMHQHGFRLLERTDFESAAGRDHILSFAFQRVSA